MILTLEHKIIVRKGKEIRMNHSNIKKLGTILGIWAHPDDEAFISGGIMTQAIKNGQRVVCITATKGERGGREKKITLREMAKIRQKEMRDSLAVLGIKEHHFLGYIDGECKDANEKEVTGKILKVMRYIQPNTILTFGPDGMTGHHDHQAVSRWTTEAYKSYGKGAIFYAATSNTWSNEFVPFLNKFNIFNPGFPKVTPNDKLAINFTLPDKILELKLAAIFAHKSQVEHMIQEFGVDFFIKSNQNETFRRP